MKIPITKQFVIRFFGTKKPYLDFNFQSIRSILISPLGDAVGDAIINLAYAKQLRTIYPSLKLGILVTDRNKDIFFTSSLFDNLIKRTPINYIKERRKWDLMLDFGESLDSKSIIISSILAPKVTMIFHKKSRKYYSMQNIKNYDFYCPYNPENHVVKHLETSIFSDFFTVPNFLPELSIPKKNLGDILNLWGRNYSEKVKIFIAPQGSVPFKCLPASELANLLNLIDHKLLPHIRFLFCNSKAGEEYYSQLKPLCNNNIDISLAPKTSVAQYIAITASADIVIGVDSGTVHLACALKKPLLSFYVNHNLHSWGPLYHANIPHFTALAHTETKYHLSEESAWNNRSDFPLQQSSDWLNQQIMKFQESWKNPSL